jgi:hypothetical protein
VHATTKDKSDDAKDSFYEKLEYVFSQFHKYHMKVLFEDFSATVSKLLPNYVVQQPRRQPSSDQNCIQGEIKSRLNSGNACYHPCSSESFVFLSAM